MNPGFSGAATCFIGAGEHVVMYRPIYSSHKQVRNNDFIFILKNLECIGEGNETVPSHTVRGFPLSGVLRPIMGPTGKDSIVPYDCDSN